MNPRKPFIPFLFMTEGENLSQDLNGVFQKLVRDHSLSEFGSLELLAPYKS